VWERGQQIEVPRQSGTILEGFVTDLTDQKQHEQQVETQRDNLELLNRVVRHDIRNKLQLVEIYADMLQSEVGEEHEDQVEKVLDAANTAVDITRTARDVTRVMLGSDADRTPVRLRPAAEDEIDDIRSDYRHALFVVDGSIPDVEVYADDMLGSVFRNLLVNAVQHNDSDLPEVTVSASTTDETAVVRVADNGPGIPDDLKEQVFEQTETGLDSEGTGLGLYLVRTLIERYGGTVRVEDNDPRGAAFVVELPLGDASATSA